MKKKIQIFAMAVMAIVLGGYVLPWALSEKSDVTVLAAIAVIAVLLFFVYSRLHGAVAGAVREVWSENSKQENHNEKDSNDSSGPAGPNSV